MPDEAELKRAYNAFKKKLKHMLAEEASGGKYGIGGRASTIQAITPPTEFSAEVWSVLADQGKLIRAAAGMYSMPKNPPIK